MSRKQCELCGERPAEVPDRERMGRPIKRVCKQCHAARLRGDMEYIMAMREKRRQRMKGMQDDG